MALTGKPQGDVLERITVFRPQPAPRTPAGLGGKDLPNVQTKLDIIGD
jgi:hypothetical protein